MQEPKEARHGHELQGIKRSGGLKKELLSQRGHALSETFAQSYACHRIASQEWTQKLVLYLAHDGRA